VEFFLSSSPVMSGALFTGGLEVSSRSYRAVAFLLGQPEATAEIHVPLLFWLGSSFLGFVLPACLC